MNLAWSFSVRMYSHGPQRDSIASCSRTSGVTAIGDICALGSREELANSPWASSPRGVSDSPLLMSIDRSVAKCYSSSSPSLVNTCTLAPRAAEVSSSGNVDLNNLRDTLASLLHILWTTSFAPEVTRCLLKMHARSLASRRAAAMVSFDCA